MVRELERKSAHIFSALAPLSFLFFPKTVLFYLLIFGSILFVGADYLRRYGEIYRSLFYIVAGWAMREDEKEKNTLTGASWLFISMSFILLIFPLNIAIPSLLIMHWCDAMAALVGKKWGRHRWIREHTVEGSLAFIFTGVLILSFGFPSIPFTVALITVILATFAESLFAKIDDNILIPLVSAVSLFLLGQ